MLINLMPWRQQQRARNRKVFLSISTLGLLLVLSINGYWYGKHWLQRGYWQDTIRKQTQQLAKINRNLVTVQKKRDGIQSQQKSWRVIAELLARISHKVGNDLSLKELRYRDQELIVNGQVSNMAKLFELIVYLQQAPLLSAFRLQSFDKNPEHYQFQLQNTVAK